MISKICHNTKFSFGTKTGTLERLSSLFSFSRIPELCSFTVQEWKSEQEAILQKVRSRFGHRKVIIRSSALTEDTATFAMAGLFDSVPNILVRDKGSLCDAINTIIRSYKKYLSKITGR